MDDGLVLNLATDEQSKSVPLSARKGGRWTDRVKARRVAKRKDRHDDVTLSQPARTGEEIVETRPQKRAREEQSTLATTSSTHDRSIHNARPSQIISSLFSYNPKVEAPTQTSPPKVSSQPSNAPLADSSTFSGLGLNPLITAHLANRMSISKPTSIQRASLAAMISPTSDESSLRDVFIQSQTGSGKTLSFLLPIVQDLLPLSSHSYINRSIGTLAIIIAPTRELAKQIADVLEILLKLRLRPESEAADDPDSPTRLTRWLVSGLLTGGATRTHEKARLRKGIPILVSTPGRLLDHLQKTSCFDTGKCRWLVLDEADRLMELGFEETITGIIKGLDGRRKLARQASETGNGMELGGWDWERRRRTVLCSATLSESVQTLAGSLLVQPLVIKATVLDVNSDQVVNRARLTPPPPATEKFTPPSQLSQKYVVVPLKLRLVALIALLRHLIAQPQRGTKIIVFLSCTDSVDFHWHLFGSSSMRGDGVPSDSETNADDNESEQETGETEPKYNNDKIKVNSSLLPGTSIFRLHGSLPTPTRLASLREFSAVPSTKSAKKSIASSSSILLCTSVASRGLDLPLVRAVIQYDLPTEGGATEYVHRVGRTARAGKGGQAWSFVSPSEAEWVKWVEGKMRGDVKDDSARDEKENITLEGVAVESILRTGFGGKGPEYEARATEVQLSFERWVLHHKQNGELARKAFLSHMRAYATHPSNEKHIFHIRHLHIGHLAKSFALRDAPKAATQKSHATTNAAKSTTKSSLKHRQGKKGRDDDVAEMRMQEVVRAQGRFSKKGGVMMSTGTSEFQIATTSTMQSS